jgi:O-antigen ligase/polysaccharide polymerase Wzy-like membrane protein
VLPLVLVLAMAAGSTQRIERDVRAQVHAFIHLYEPGEGGSLSSASTSARLLSGGGNRYDYWRIAWGVWRGHPLLGVGAGNYPRPYYERRATTEDIQQPHSLELQALSELGLVGALLLLAFIVGVGWGAARMRRRAARSALSRGLMTGAVGVFTAWLVQTSVDWMHLLPGLTAVALSAAAVIVWPRTANGGTAQRKRSWLGHELAGRSALALGVSAVIVTLIVAGASLSRQGLADLYRTRAQHELRTRPAAALSDAQRSLDIDNSSLQAYYVKAAALARFNQAAGAEAALTRALAREPHNFVTWTLLGDVAVRQRKLHLASHYYERARALNPRNSTLRELAPRPGSALG